MNDEDPPTANTASVWPLLDGASSPHDSLEAEFQRQRAVAADPRQEVEDRLAAFDDIIDSEVGDTNLSRARHLEREFGLRQLYLKFEGGNPTGTQKDRIAFAQVRDALRRGYSGITVATCGNYGAAVALASSLAGLRAVITIPETYHTRRLAEMELPGVEIVRAGRDYEAAVDSSRQRADTDELYDANAGGSNTQLQIDAYGAIAYEIYDDLHDAPAAVAVPVSNGTTLAGLYKGFLSLYRRGKTSRIPRIIAGSSHNKNPVVNSFLKRHESCQDLDPRRVRETSINEPLINWHSSEGDLALEAIRRTGGWADNASDREMQHHARRLRDKESLSVLPAASAGLVVLLGRHRREPLPNDRYVVVVTGRR